MTKKEKEIIDKVRQLVDSEPQWQSHSIYELDVIICEVMGYKTCSGWQYVPNTDIRDGAVMKRVPYWYVEKEEDKLNLMKIEKGMERANIIKLTCSGTAFRLL